MNTNETSDIVTERVDDIPLLLTHLMQMGIPDLLDAHFPTHNNWEGLSLGWTATIWLTHILSQADHRLNKVQDWVAKHIQTISGVTGLTIRALEFSDDRLPAILRYLNQDESWQKYEIDQGKHLIRVYDLSTDIVRLDPTTASSHVKPTEGGLFQLGHSKDYRPDLAQVKVMLASLDPLGLPLATQVVEGNEADDPLYEPALKQVRRILNREGVLYVGDCKMAASSIRAGIEDSHDYYLMPLPATIVTPEVLDTYLASDCLSSQTIEPIYRCDDNGFVSKIADGFELTETVTGEIDGKTIAWLERRLVIRSLKYAEAQKEALHKRLNKAKTAIADLTRPRSGYKCITTLDLFWPAVNDILKHYNVEGLFEIEAQESIIEHHRRRYRDKPARIEIQQMLDVHVNENETAKKTTINRLGWRVYATNAPKEKLSLDDAVLAYREEYIIERGFGRLKGKPLSLTPMYLQRSDHATGLIRLLTIGLRVLTLLEFVVRSKLSETGTHIAGLYAGNPKRRTSRPTAEALLRAFNYIDLIGFKETDGISYYLTPLTALQQCILELLGFSSATYTQLTE
jgi:transposase